MPEFLEHISGTIHTKFQPFISSSFSGKNSYIILRYRRFSEKGPQKVKILEIFQFKLFYQPQPLFSASLLVDTSFWQVLGIFI